MALADIGDGRHGVDAGGGGGADGGGDAAGAEARGEIALDHLAQGVRQHAEFGVDGDEADVIVADADGDGALGDGGVRLFGGVDHQAAGRALGARVGVGGLARGGDGVHAAGGSGVVDEAEPVVGQSGPVTQPAEGHLFEFGGGGRCFPDHAVGIEGGGEQLAEDAFGGGGIGEIGHEPGMVPERRGGHNEALEIGEDGGHRLAALGAAGGQSVGELAGLDGRQHGKALGMREIFGDPIDGPVAKPAEFFRRHETSAHARHETNLPRASLPGIHGLANMNRPDARSHRAWEGAIRGCLPPARRRQGGCGDRAYFHKSGA